MRRLTQATLVLVFAGCGGSSSETPFPLEPELAMLDASGPPRSSEYVVFTGQSSEPDPGPPPERKPLPPEPEPDASVTIAEGRSLDAGRLVDAGKARDGGKPGDAGAIDASLPPAPPKPKPVPKPFAKEAGTVPQDAGTGG